MASTIAIIGASGTNATPWTDAFLAAGWKVRNLVRDPERVGPQPNRAAAALNLDDRREDEARIGQKNGQVRQSARRGTPPRQPAMSSSTSTRSRARRR
jgi:hypothetical protein